VEEDPSNSYFEDDNKDRYFTPEQVDYYEKNCKYRLRQWQDEPSRKFCIRNFLIANEIGNGSFGRVYQGFDNDHGLVIAVKQVPISNLSSTQQCQEKVRLRLNTMVENRSPRA